MSRDLIKQNTVDLQSLLGMVETLPDASDGHHDTYNGTCEVTPTAEEQTLATANKVVPSDITINKIPYAEVSNPAGGVTVIIG